MSSPTGYLHIHIIFFTFSLAARYGIQIFRNQLHELNQREEDKFELGVQLQIKRVDLQLFHYICSADHNEQPPDRKNPPNGFPS